MSMRGVYATYPYPQSINRALVDLSGTDVSRVNIEFPIVRDLLKCACPSPGVAKLSNNPDFPDSSNEEAIDYSEMQYCFELCNSLKST
jgi:hypothetical protein